MDTTPLDNFTPEEDTIKSLKGRTKRLIIYIFIMIVLNLIISMFIKGSGGRHLNGTLATEAEVKIATIKTFLVGIPFFGFIIGLIVSFIPYKNLKYWNKYIYFSLISVIVIYIIAFLLGIRNLLLFSPL